LPQPRLSRFTRWWIIGGSLVAAGLLGLLIRLMLPN
jgi:hypothetical protein